MNATLKTLLFLIVLMVIGVMFWNLTSQFGPRAQTVMFSEFMTWVDQNQVAKVSITGNEILGTTKGNDTFRTHTPNYENLVPRLLEKGVQIDVKPGRNGWASLLATWAPALAIACALPLAILVVMMAMLRHIRRIDDKLDKLTSAGGGSARP